MKITSILILAASLATAIIPANAASSPNSDDAQMRALKQSLDDASAAYQASTNDVDDKLWKTYKQLVTTNLPQILDLAQKDPASQTAFEMFSWIAMKGLYERGPVFTNRIQAVEMLAKYHATNSGVGLLCGFIGHNWEWRWREKPVMDFLEAVAKNNPEHANRGQAIFALGCLYANKSQTLVELENWGTAPFLTNGSTMNATAELAEFGNSRSAANEAERQLKNVIANYADCRDLRDRHGSKTEAPLLKTEAEKELFELLHLSLGKVAPEIEAESIDGKKFKLSDSRGKITVLSFWASWCGPCMQLVPVERALNERITNKPFAMIGVNGDAIQSDAKRAMEHEQMTWPSFWNGKGGSDGPISSAWNVDSWPTVYVLDSDGVIRFKYEGYGLQTSNVLNGCVDELMKQLESRKKFSLKN